MKIAIIGGGWVGCHLANKLKQEHEITIFEKESKLFTKTSFNNQNRLHLGYHYPRSFKTRELCRRTYDSFLQDYPTLCTEVQDNYYCLSVESNIDFRTYLQIFQDYDYEIIDIAKLGLRNVEGCLKTKERHINFLEASYLFNKELSGMSLFGVEIIHTDDLKSKFDLVINATNNFLNHSDNSYFELTCTWIYKKTTDVNFGAITVVDGNFFSIYPYANDLYTFTDVEYTPIKTFETSKELENYQLEESLMSDHRAMMENKISSYYSDFENHFEYVDVIQSVKSKTVNQSADRYPVINIEDNLINVFTGKIQGVYVIEDSIREIINAR